MRLSNLFHRSKRQASKQDSIGSYLLDRAGYVSQASSGVYNLLPLGNIVVNKIENIIRSEMNKLGASEVYLPSLQTKKLWKTAGRWDDRAMREILFLDSNEEYCFAPTHEELMTQIAKETVSSYRDLPILLYQFQTKFRRELRARAGLLRGREFKMKDLYSFHATKEEHLEFYEQAANAYIKSFTRLGLDAVRTKASGGVFGKEYSDEFQVILPQGEDQILLDKSENIAYNCELEKEIDPKKLATLERLKGIEVGNIFHLGIKYSEAFNLTYADKQGNQKPVVMGSYGIGVTRLLGTLAELFNDQHGLIFPFSVAPFQVYVADLTSSGEGQEIVSELEKANVEVLYDDRPVPNGEKLIESDLLGIPIRVVISDKLITDHSVEIKIRKTGETEILKKDNFVAEILKKINFFSGSIKS